MKGTSTEPGLLYEQIGREIRLLIEQKTLRPGDRVPSVRKMSRQHGVSISTVLQAYLNLENEGVIEARPQSGYYVKFQRLTQLPEPGISTPAPSPTLVGIDSLVASVFETARDPSIVSLGAATPSPELLPAEKLNRVMASVARRAAHVGVNYDFPPGSELLRHQIARRSMDWGGHISIQELVTTSGSMEAMSCCLNAVARAGDTVAVESPTYYGILQLIERHGMKVVEIPTHPREGISLDDLERSIKRHRIKACIFIPTFNNPLGSCMPEENRKQLATLLAKHQIPLIEDDIYGDLFHTGSRPKPVKAYDK